MDRPGPGNSLVAIQVAERPADCTFGYARLEILAAAFNALLLFAVAFLRGF